MRLGQVFSLLVALALAGCGGAELQRRDVTEALSERELGLQPGQYVSRHWVVEDWLLVGLAGERGAAEPARLFRVGLDGSGWREVTPPVDPACGAQTHFLALGESWDGRVLVHHRCLGASAGMPGKLGALDVASGGWQVLVDDLGKMALASASLHPERREGLVSFNTDFCVGMARVTAAGFAELPVMMGQGEDAWRVDDDFFAPRDCDGGRAFAPQWSPDGGRVAFLASEPAGRGWARVDEPWGLWVMDAEQREPRLLVDGFHDAAGLRWSPDGRWLSLVAHTSRSASADRKLFAYDTRDGDLYELAGGAVVGATWSPDGTRMLVSRRVNPDDPTVDLTTELILLDLTPLVGD